MLNGFGGAMNRLGYTWDRGMFGTDRGQYDELEAVLSACSGVALFRKSAFLTAGGFDRRFFMYQEAVDLCCRFWLLGWQVITPPSARGLHESSGSTRKSRLREFQARASVRPSTGR